jgi:hypothetical protein
MSGSTNRSGAGTSSGAMSGAGVVSGPSAGQATRVPTFVAAGEEGALREWQATPSSLAVMAGGLLLVAAGIARRSRSRG